MTHRASCFACLRTCDAEPMRGFRTLEWCNLSQESVNKTSSPPTPTTLSCQWLERAACVKWNGLNVTRPTTSNCIAHDQFTDSTCSFGSSEYRLPCCTRTTLRRSCRPKLLICNVPPKCQCPPRSSWRASYPTAGCSTRRCKSTSLVGKMGGAAEEMDESKANEQTTHARVVVQLAAQPHSYKGTAQGLLADAVGQRQDGSMLPSVHSPTGGTHPAQYKSWWRSTCGYPISLRSKRAAQSASRQTKAAKRSLKTRSRCVLPKESEASR